MRRSYAALSVALSALLTVSGMPLLAYGIDDEPGRDSAVSGESKSETGESEDDAGSDGDLVELSAEDSEGAVSGSETIVAQDESENSSDDREDSVGDDPWPQGRNDVPDGMRIDVLSTSGGLKPLEISGDVKYFAKYESNANYDQGFSSGDGYNAMGFYQFDRRSTLRDFIVAVYKYNPKKYAMFAQFESVPQATFGASGAVYANGAFTALGSSLNDAWHAAYKADATEFSALQDAWAYSNYYKPAENYLLSRGIDISKRADCVKGLCWGLANLFGLGGWRKFVGGVADGYDWNGVYQKGYNWPGCGLNNSMSDTQFVTTLCNYVVANVSIFYKAQPLYHKGWQTRYKNELNDCLRMLSADSGNGGGSGGSSADPRPSLDEAAAKGAALLADGEYWVSPASAPAMMLDVKSGSLANYANVQLWSSNGGAAQRWRVTHDAKGYVTLVNAKSGKALDVYGGNAARYANVQQYAPNGSWAQKWILAAGPDGSVRLLSAVAPGYALDFYGGVASDGANVQLYADNSSAAQRWRFVRWADPRPSLDEAAAKGAALLADGEYWVSPASAPAMMLDVKSGSLANYANVQLWSSNGGAAQRWRVTHDAKGYVTLVNAKSGKALDVYGGNAARYANVQQYAPNGSWAQKWILAAGPDGSVRLLSAVAPGYALDFYGGVASDGANVQLYADNSSAAQRWFFDVADSPVKGGAVLPDGTYEIVSSCNENYAVGSKAMKVYGDDAYRIERLDHSDGQQFRISYGSDGYYTITNKATGKLLGTQFNSVATSHPVFQSSMPAGTAQKWVIRKAGDAYMFINALNGQVLDFNAASIASGVRMLTKRSNENLNQRWFVVAKSAIPDGLYRISSKLDNKLVVDVKSSSLSAGANIQLWTSNNALAQKWYVENEPGGIRLRSACSGLYATVDSATGNVCQRARVDDGSQLWKPILSKGGYALQSVLTAKMLDVQSGRAVPGANVRTANANGSSAQAFSFVSDESFYASTAISKVAKLVIGGASDATSLEVGNRMAASVSCLPATAVGKVDLEWFSSDPSVVGVSPSGVMTAKRPGWADVTARLKSNPSVSATIRINARKTKGYLTKDALDKAGAAKCSKLMIVAHPDDETFWGGGHLLESRNGYLVVCLTNGFNPVRVFEFNSAMNISGSTGIILSYPDTIGGVRDGWANCSSAIEADLATLLSYKNWEVVATHSTSGETGHAQHLLTNKYVTSACLKMGQTSKLKYFGRFYAAGQVPASLEPSFGLSTLLLKAKMARLYRAEEVPYQKYWRQMLPYEHWTSY